MDYGKLAYTKLEDLNRKISEKTDENGSYNILLYDYEDTVSFTGNFKSSAVIFNCVKETALAVDISIVISSTADLTSKCSINLNNALLDTKVINIITGTRQYNFSFLCSGLTKGENNLNFCITCLDTITRQKKGLYIKLSGEGIENITTDSKIVISEEGGYTIASYNDRDYIYYQMVDGSYKFILSSKYLKRGDYSFCSSLYYSGGIKCDVIYFFIDEGKLYMNVRPYDSDFVTYRMLIDENVSSISCVKSEKPYGCMLFYIKSGTVYCRPVLKDSVLNKILPLKEQKIIFSPGAKNVTAVNGFENGCAFILNENSGKNTMYMHIGTAESAPADTINASVNITIEDNI